MIQAELFVRSDGTILGFRLTGHAETAEYGQDTLCAFVSSAAYMTANTITEVIRADACAQADDGYMYVRVSEQDAPKCREILAGFQLHLLGTEEQYPEYLKVINTEV